MTEHRITENPLTGARCQEMLHESGLTVRVCEQPGFHTAAMRLSVKFGAMHLRYRAGGEEILLPHGTAHYLEHQLFETEDINAMAQFDTLGAYANAATGYDSTYYMANTAANIPEVLTLLLKTVQEPHFTPQSVEKERGIIGQELRQRLDNPFYASVHEIVSVCYPDHPYAEEILGTMKSLRQITPEILYQAHRDWYQPAHMLLSCAGNVTAEQVAEIVDRVFVTPGQVREISAQVPPCSPVPAQRSLTVYNRHLAAPYIRLCFLQGTETGSAEERYRRFIYGGVIQQLIFSDISGFQERMRAAGTEVGSLRSNGTFSPYFSEHLLMADVNGDTPPEELCDAVFAELARVRSEGLDPQLFRSCQRAAYANACGAQSTPEQTAGRLDKTWQYGVSPYFSQQCMAQCTQEALEALVPALFCEEHTLCAIVLPEEAGEEGED